MEVAAIIALIIFLYWREEVTEDLSSKSGNLVESDDAPQIRD